MASLAEMRKRMKDATQTTPPPVDRTVSDRQAKIQVEVEDMLAHMNVLGLDEITIQDMHRAIRLEEGGFEVQETGVRSWTVRRT